MSRKQRPNRRVFLGTTPDPECYAHNRGVAIVLIDPCGKARNSTPGGPLTQRRQAYEMAGHPILLFVGLAWADCCFLYRPFPLLGEDDLLDLVAFRTPSFLWLTGPLVPPLTRRRVGLAVLVLGRWRRIGQSEDVIRQPPPEPLVVFKLLKSCMSSLSTAVITRFRAWSCSIRAFCLSEFSRALR